MIQIIALLYASEQGIEGLRAFEAKTLPLLREHGGTLLSASFNEHKSAHEPDEIHVLQFLSAEHFKAYQQDPRVLSLASLKAKMIRKADVYMTNAFHEYD